MRLVDADALIMALKRKAPISDSMRVMLAECLQEVRLTPTIEPERKTGEWITSDDMYETGICSCCRYDTQEPVSYVITNFVYCPNCGSYNGGD